MFIYVFFMIFQDRWVQENQGVTFLVAPPKDKTVMVVVHKNRNVM